MAEYKGRIIKYRLQINTANIDTNYQRTINIGGGFGLAVLYFVPDGGQLGTNKKKPGHKRFVAYFWESAWGPIVDMLRNEDTTSFFYNTKNNTASVHTGEEPVGEQES